MSKFKFNLDDIENKVFSIDFKGYSSLEVDTFLDEVMNDIEAYQEEIERLNNLASHYDHIISELSQENQYLKAKIASSEANGKTSSSTIDLIRRVARLEEIVLHKNEQE